MSACPIPSTSDPFRTSHDTDNDDANLANRTGRDTEKGNSKGMNRIGNRDETPGLFQQLRIRLQRRLQRRQDCLNVVNHFAVGLGFLTPIRWS